MLKGLFAALGGLLAVGVLWIMYRFNPTEHGFYPRCPLYVWTGLQCPGCGGLRAVHQMLHGHWREAYAFNPLVVLLTPFVPLMVIGHWLPGRPAKVFLQRPVVGWGLTVLFLGFGVLRNVW